MQPRSIRLNQDLRDDFINTVIQEIMNPDQEPTIPRYQDQYAQEAYDATYGVISGITSQLPPWATRLSRCFFVKLEGVDDEIPFIMPHDVVCFHKEDYEQYSNYHMRPDSGSPIPTLPAEHPVTQAYKAQVQALTDWNSKRQALRKQLRELTNSCNTTGQLFKTWPKAMEFAHIFPQPEVKERKKWEPEMDAAELDLGVQLSQVEVAPIKEN